MKPDFDIIVVGSGFGGSLLAMIAKRLGKSVLLLERGTHPRVVIGESTTPVSNMLLDDLATRYDLPRLRPLTKWGTWQRAYPELGCGLKRGFTFYRGDEDFFVEASSRDDIADTHWYRADVDYFFVEEARRIGVDYLDRIELKGATFTDRLATVFSETQRWTAGFLVDATGPRGFLHRALELEERPLPGMPETSALYSHFTGVEELESPPAADHHLFDDGWIWVLQFNNGITSAGVAAKGGLGDWQRLLDRMPALERQFSNATPLFPFRRIERMPFRSASIAGRRWALLPSAAGFVDPLLSTGFPLTLFGIARLAEMIERGFDEGAYAVETDRDLLAAARLIAALYANMGDFRKFVALSMLYFVPVIYSESSQRLGCFLMRDHKPFASASTRILERALQPIDSADLEEEIAAACSLLDVDGGLLRGAAARRIRAG